MNLEQDAVIEAELLGCLIKDPELMDTFTGKFDKFDFVHPTHLKIWESLMKLHGNNIPINAKSVYEMDHDIDRSYLYDVINHVASPLLAKHYAEKLELNSAYRKVHAYASKLLGIVQDRDKNTPADLLAEADSLLLRLRRKETSSMRSVSDMREMFSKALKEKANLVPTGRASFDKHYGGIPRKALYILAGRTHVGKTAEALQMAYNMANQEEGAVLYWAQEMTTVDLLERLSANLSGFNYGKITRRDITDYDHDKIMKEGYEKIASVPFHIDETPRVKIHTVRATANMFKRKYGKLAALFIDYLSMMDIEQKSNQSFAKAVGEIAFDAKALAKELDCPVVIVAQINRAGAEKERPESHHLKESGDIEQAADFIEILWKDDELQNPSLGFEVITSTITKGRKGGLSEFYYKLIGSIQRYEEYTVPKTENIKVDDEGHITNHRKRGRQRA